LATKTRETFPHFPDIVRRGSYKYEAVFFTGLYKIGPFRQKTVSRMNSIGTASQGGGNHRLHLQITVDRLRGSYANGPVGCLCRLALPVGRRHRYYCFYSQVAASPYDTQGDLAPVGHKDS